eukprot:TRINITY_DN13194_c0_g1_i1.p1 TRINITY_DN13194_c0_g1~~TRINITY_DN13194_c0_g1_i1.p1  ORF type:complete len:115 (-),score=23.05 TRINITY_DN13194_c0_g1_i1:274-618(-)
MARPVLIALTLLSVVGAADVAGSSADVDGSSAADVDASRRLSIGFCKPGQVTTGRDGCTKCKCPPSGVAFTNDSRGNINHMICDSKACLTKPTADDEDYDYYYYYHRRLDEVVV